MRRKETLGMRLTANAQNAPQDRAMSALLLRGICIWTQVLLRLSLVLEKSDR